jgi:hypothetical protein
MALHTRAMIANQKFIYKKEGDHLKGKLKYFQHRDDRQTHIKQFDEQGNRIQRWMDRGLGGSHKAIAASCEQLATTGLKNEVGARTLVLSPQVEFMAAIPAERRSAVMAELTEATVESWFEAMNLPTAEYAFVVHQGDVKNDRPDGVEQDTREFVHSHVVLAATVPGLMQERDNYKVYKEQLDDLHRVSAEAMERIWTRELGAERVAELNQDLEALTERLHALDQAREREALEAAIPDERAVDETLLEIYAATGMEPPTELLERVYDARDIDPIADLKLLGFVFDDEELDVIQDMEKMGFDFSGAVQVEVEPDVVAVARELGFAIPEDTHALYEEESHDLLEAFRELGFLIPRDDAPPADQLADILDELQELGFDIPLEDDLEPNDPVPDIEIE